MKAEKQKSRKARKAEKQRSRKSEKQVRIEPGTQKKKNCRKKKKTNINSPPIKNPQNQGIR
jgi:hypothetical protein